MTRVQANLVLLLAAAIWGGGFVAQSTATHAIGPFWFIGLRFLVAPRAASADYGLPVRLPDVPTQSGGTGPWLQVKGVRDIASGIFIGILLASRQPHLLGAFMVAATLIPAGDSVIVLRNGGTRASAFGIHGVTAAVMLAAGITLLTA